VPERDPTSPLFPLLVWNLPVRGSAGWLAFRQWCTVNREKTVDRWVEAMGKEFRKSACPHDCPSACCLEVERLSSTRIGRIRGAAANSYTDGVVCAKVARYAERVHHPDRLRQPLQRTGEKGQGAFRPISWDAALDEVAEALGRATQAHGAESVWPYHSGGTMGIVQRWGIDRLRHAFGYSRQKTTICVTPAESGWRAGVGRLTGPDPREMAESDLIVVWGGNPVSTQVNAMTHIAKARKQRGAKLVVVDVYRTPTVEAADIGLVLRPGTDGALALAMMHLLLKEGFADRDYLARYTDFGPEIEAHLAGKTPQWASAITGLPVAEIEGFARLYALAQRLGGDARRDLPAVDHRRLAASGRRCVLPQSRQLAARHHPGARARPHEPGDAGARPVAHRAGPVQRSRRAGRRPAGDGDADAERQLGERRARQRFRGARVGPRRSLPLRS
jgi:anaerobic selenocysteine-containing dehydrogenase